MSAEGIADRSSVTQRVAGTELDVIVDEIEVCLRSDEQPTVHVDLQSSAKLPEKMGAGRVVGAAGEAAI